MFVCLILILCILAVLFIVIGAHECIDGVMFFVLILLAGSCSMISYLLGTLK